MNAIIAVLMALTIFVSYGTQTIQTFQETRFPTDIGTAVSIEAQVPYSSMKHLAVTDETPTPGPTRESSDEPVARNSSSIIIRSSNKSDTMENIFIPYYRSRMTLVQREKAPYSITYSSAQTSGTFASDTGRSNTVAIPDEILDYVHVETEGEWALRFEELKRVDDPIDLGGYGDFVSDIYRIDEPTPILIDGLFLQDGTFTINVFTSVFGDKSWQETTLFSETRSAGETVLHETTLPIDYARYCFFEVDFNDGSWTIKEE